MNITEVVVYIPDRLRADSKLVAFATVVLDGAFAIRNVRIIRRCTGEMLLSMPSRRVEDACHACRAFNHLLARYCNECGEPLDENRVGRKADGSPILDRHGRPQVHEDQAHPISEAARAEIQAAVMEAYEREARRLQEVR